MSDPVCWFADRDAGPCDGRLIRAHLIPRQVLKREFQFGVILDSGGWRRLERNEDRYQLRHRSLRELHDDPRGWVPCCGGPSGIGGHHGQRDFSRTLRIPFDDLPSGFLEFLDELGLGWYAEREYGQGARS